MVTTILLYPSDNEWIGSMENGERDQSLSTRMHDFVRDMIQFRKIVTMLLSRQSMVVNAFLMENPSNYDMSGDDWSSKAVMMHYYNSAGQSTKNFLS